MKLSLALASIALAGCTITLHEDPKLLQAIDANTAHMDRLTLSVDRATAATPQPPAALPKHVVCRGGGTKDAKLVPVEAVDKGEKDLGAVTRCPPPNEDGICVGGEAESNVLGRCAAGKS